MEDGDAKRFRIRLGEPFLGPFQLRRAQRAALMPERSRRVEPDDVEPWKRGRGLGRLPDPLELRPGTHEPRRRVREIVVAGYREHGRPERTEHLSRTLELRATTAMRKIP